MKSEKGQSLVEFALVVPLLILLLFGIADFGRIFHAYLTLDHAGREAARTASIGNNVYDVENVVKEALNFTAKKISIKPKEENISLNPDGTFPSGSHAKITITYDVEIFTPIIREIVNLNGGSYDLTLTDTTVMRVE